MFLGNILGGITKTVGGLVSGLLKPPSVRRIERFVKKQRHLLKFHPQLRKSRFLTRKFRPPLLKRIPIFKRFRTTPGLTPIRRLEMERDGLKATRDKLRARVAHLERKVHTLRQQIAPASKPIPQPTPQPAVRELGIRSEGSGSESNLLIPVLIAAGGIALFMVMRKRR